MSNFNALKTALCLLIGALSLTCCTQPESPDDFTNLKAFESELSQMCRQHPEMCCSPSLSVAIAGGHVVSINIDGRGRAGQGVGLNQLPKSIYQFHHLAEFSLLSTGFDQIPDLRPFSNLTKVTIEYNIFKGAVHLKNLPLRIENLILSRDGITEVVVDDSLPHLSRVYLTQNRMGSRINSTFCKLRALEFLDLSSGCCTTLAQQVELENAAKKVLCNKDVAVLAKGEYID